MPQAKAQANTDTSGNAQGRFTVQLPADLRPKIEALGADLVASFVKDKGIAIDLSMAQVVGGIISAQHDVMVERREAEAKAKAEAESTESEA